MRQRFRQNLSWRSLTVLAAAVVIALVGVLIHICAQPGGRLYEDGWWLSPISLVLAATGFSVSLHDRAQGRSLFVATESRRPR